MKKENNQEFYVEQMDVHYPLQSEIQNEIEDIILKGMPQKISKKNEKDLSGTWIKSHLL